MSDVKMTMRRARTPRERAMLILLGIVVALALGAVLLTRLGGGVDDVEATPTRTPTPTQGASPGPVLSPSPSPTQTTPPVLPPSTIENFEGRDPFQPLIVPPPPADGGGGGDGGGGDGGGGDGGGGDGGGGGTDGGGDGNGDGGSTARQRVTLHEIFTQGGQLTARVSVDDTEYTVSEGDTFADNFRLIDLTADCGTFVHGDERFELCTGDEVLK